MSTSPTAYHLGRQGNIAGGMTQVINDYLSWNFPRFTQRLIVTRASGRVATAKAFLSAWRALGDLRPQDSPVIVAHLSQRGAFVREGSLAVRAYRRGLPVVAQLHGSSFPEFSQRHARLTRWVLSHAHVIHVLSAETASAVAALGLRAEVVLVPNAVSEGPPAAKKNIVVFGGALSRRKGIDVLFAAWRQVPAADWQLVAIGPVLEPDLTVDLPDRVLVPGQLTRDELRQKLAEARIAVLPSVNEAMPLFVLEALASGAAMIATPVGGIPSVINGDNGILVPTGDAEKLADALQLLMTDDQRRDAIASAGHETWRARYSADAVIPQLERVWQQALALAATPTLRA